MTIRVYIWDGMAHRRIGGYGSVSRGLIQSLAGRPDISLFLQGSKDAPFWNEEAMAGGGYWPSFKQLCEALPQFSGDWGALDVVLRIGSPREARKPPVPMLWFTGNGLSDLTPDFVRFLSIADGHIVSTEYDRLAFERHFPNIYVAGQAGNASVFRSVPSYRSEGPENFTFFFVGSYGFRKGTDVLVRAFAEEFRRGEATLVMHCVNERASFQYNHVMRVLSEVGGHARVEMYHDARSDAWMNRWYNRADCFVTLSRGESWCLPPCEAALCQKPLIVPNAHSFGEYVPRDLGYFVRASSRLIKDIDDPMAGSLVSKYGHGDVALFEPDLGDARAVMRHVFEAADERAERAAGLFHHFSQIVTWSRAADQVADAIKSFMKVGQLKATVPTEDVGVHFRSERSSDVGGPSDDLEQVHPGDPSGVGSGA